MLSCKRKWHLDNMYKKYWEMAYTYYNKEISKEILDRIIRVQFHNMLLEMLEAFDIKDKEMDQYLKDFLNRK